MIGIEQPWNWWTKIAGAWRPVEKYQQEQAARDGRPTAVIDGCDDSHPTQIYQRRDIGAAIVEPVEPRRMFAIWLVPPTKPFIPDGDSAFYVRGETVEIGPSVQAGQEG